MKTLYLDSNILIYLAQPHSDFFTAASRVLELADKRGQRLITSPIGVAEYMVARQRNGLERTINPLFAECTIIEIPFGHAEALAYAAFRQKTDKTIHPVDAMHFAAALAAGASNFITNDYVLHKLKIAGLSVIPLTTFN